MKPSFAFGYLILFPALCSAHYHMLLPEPASAKKGEAIRLVYQWGHPFEHQLFDAALPEEVVVVAPDGKRTELTKGLKKFTMGAAESNKAVAYRFTFQAEERGDYLFVARSGPVWMAEDREYLQDTVKVVLHVQVQKGWDGLAGMPLEIRPLTRPYGLQPGMAFQAQVEIRQGPSGRPLAGALVEIEHYHPVPPAALPADEHITRTAKADPNGVVTCSLMDPGWWCITAVRDGGMKERDGKPYRVRQRSTLWVFVDEPSVTK